MNSDFATAMRRALDHTRAGSLDKATAGIQTALLGKSMPDDGPDGPVATTGMSPPPIAMPRPGTQNHGRKQPATAPSPRRSLKEVVDALTRKRASGLASLMPGGTAQAATASPEVPPGADFQRRTFTSAQGSRDYRLYVPVTQASGVRGLVIMLHGCTQNPDDFAAGTGMNAVAEREGLLIAYPGQTQTDNASACWNWFRPGDQQRDLGEPALLAGLARALTLEFSVDPKRVFIAGFSAGGAMAAVMAAAYPDLFAAVGIHSGLAHGAASDVISAFAAMRGDGRSSPSRRTGTGDAAPLRTIVFHGRADGTVHPVNAERVIQAGGRDLARAEKVMGGAEAGRPVERTVWRAADGASEAELWLIEGAGHAWAGGNACGSYTDPQGPDASAEMIRFFLNDVR